MVNTAETLFTSTISFLSITTDAISKARERFEDFQDSGVISPKCSYDDSVWQTTDEYSNVGMHFNFNAVSYKKYYEPLFGFPLETFIEAVKAFVVSIMGRNALLSIQSVLRDFRSIINTSPDRITRDLKLYMPLLCGDFFAILPGAEENAEIARLCEAMESYAEAAFAGQTRTQRTLADFDSYFRFGDIMESFWHSTALSEELRLFYYPLYLWWAITCVIPLRPREFLLTPRNCLIKKDGKDGGCYLRLRRNRLKGGNRGVSYKIDDDYIIDTYKIPANLGEEIQRYIDLTEQYDSTDLDTLFVSDPHYRHWGWRKPSTSRYLTYMNMRTILRCFYNEIIQGQYHYSINYDTTRQHIPDGVISQIHLGDARHIALINLTQSGADPSVAMMLAGHLNEDMSSHYASNLSNLIECHTYRQYRRLTGRSSQYQLSAPSLAVLPPSKPFVPIDGGRCYSTAFKAGDISDCQSAVGPNCEIGYCPGCSHYRGQGISYFSDDDRYKSNLERECSTLQSAVKTVRTGRGNVEDIGEALLRVRSSSLSYTQYLMEKKIQGGTDGKNKAG